MKSEKQLRNLEVPLGFEGILVVGHWPEEPGEYESVRHCRWRRVAEGEGGTQPQEESTAAVSPPSNKEDFSAFARYCLLECCAYPQSCKNAGT